MLFPLPDRPFSTALSLLFTSFSPKDPSLELPHVPITDQTDSHHSARPLTLALLSGPKSSFSSQAWLPACTNGLNVPRKSLPLPALLGGSGWRISLSFARSEPATEPSSASNKNGVIRSAPATRSPAGKWLVPPTASGCCHSSQKIYAFWSSGSPRDISEAGYSKAV